MVLAAVDPSSFAVAAAIGGGVTVDDLWFFYDEHRIVVDGSGWLLAMLVAGDLTEEESRVLGRLNFWPWFVMLGMAFYTYIFEAR